MQLYFVRHGQSENNHLWDRTSSDKGRSDDPLLTEIGRRQAEGVARFLSRRLPAEMRDMMDLQNVHGFGITHIYASLMVRAIQTGSVVAKSLGLPLIALEALHEAGGIYLKNDETGEYLQRPGKHRAFFEAEFPDCVLPDGVRAEGWWNRPYESPEECLPRARRVLDELWARHDQRDDRIVVITHGAFYNFMLAVILNLPEPALERYWFVLNNVAVTRVDFVEDRVIVAYMNRVDFLPKELIT